MTPIQQLLQADKERDSSKRRGTTTRRREDDDELGLLDEITQASEEAGQRWLEFLIIKRRSLVRLPSSSVVMGSFLIGISVHLY